MRKIIDLTEQAPGVWGFALRLGRRKPTAEEIEARREAFFNSLAGPNPPKPRRYRWELIPFFVPAILGAVCGSSNLLIGLIAVPSLLILLLALGNLCSGNSWSECARNIFTVET